MNNCTFTGNLGKDAELLKVGDTSVCKFSIAVSEKGYTTRDGRVIEDKTMWLNCEKWKAEKLAQYLVKGTKVMVQGKLEIRKHEEKFYTTLRVNEVEFAGGKQDNQENQYSHPAPQPATANTQYQQPAPPTPPVVDDEQKDLPF